MNSFMSWIGGKKALRDEIVLRFPVEYSRYIEVFGGGGWVLFHKAPGRDFEVYNDFNPNLANLYRCVRDHPKELCDELTYALNSRLDFDYIRDMLHTKTELPDIKRAAYFYQIIRESYASGLDSFASQPHSMWNNFPLIQSSFRGSFHADGRNDLMSKERFIVWSNLDLNLEDWRADLEAEYPDASEDDRVRKMCEINDSYIDDERINLGINTGREIIAIADIGRWDGRYMGYSEIKSGKLSDCLYSPNDYSEWFVDKDKEFRCTDVHHDGRNHILYRKFKENATEDEIEHLKDLIYDGRATQEDIDAVTEPLGETVMQVYGWTFDTPEHIPIIGRPVGRIEFLGSNGAVCESIEYYDEERMTNAILTENYYGSPMNVVLYRDKDGKTISQDFVEKLDPPNIGFKVTDIPGTLSKDGGIKGMGGML